MRSVTAAVLLGSLFAAARLWAAAGDIDPTFGNGQGIRTETEEDLDSIIYGLVRQPDGKIVAAGYALTSPVESVIALVRYDGSGNLDPSFGVDGFTLTPLGSVYPLVRDLLQQPDGKLVVVARINLSAGGDVGLLRYDANGTLDPTFGNGGVVVTSLPGVVEDVVAGALQPGGKILVATDRSILSTQTPDDVYVLRYDSNGSLDSTFGVDGVATVDFGGFDEVAALLVHADGRIVVAGTSRNDPDLSQGSSVAVARLEVDGSLDPSFGTAGVLQHTFGTQDEPQDMVRMPDGKLLIVGASFIFIGPNAKVGSEFLLRITEAGAVDGTFGTAGAVWPTAAPAVQTLALDPAGRIVLFGGTSSLTNTLGMGVARLHADGSPDATFGNGGLVALGMAQTGSNALTGLVEPDGNLIVAGYISEPSEHRNAPYFIDYYFGIARVLGDGAACTSDADCAVCTACGPAGRCVIGPRAGCTGAEHAGARFRYDSPGVDRQSIDRSLARHRVKLKWRGPTPLGFDPTNTDDVGLCLYAAGKRILKSVAPAGGSCGSRSCWTGIPGERLSYLNLERSPGGIAKIKLSGSTVKLDAGGVHLTETQHAVPDPTVLLNLPLVLQVHAGNGLCLQASFDTFKQKTVPSDDGPGRVLVGLGATGQ